MVNETSIIKMGPQDDFNSLFYAEDLNGNFQVAHSDKTFFGSSGLDTQDAKAALNDLVTKLQAQGWQQVVGTIPDPWYSLRFQLVVYLSIKTSIIKPRQQDATHNLFYAETLDGSLEVAHSDKTFFGSPDFETEDAKAALNDLVAKLQALGWQQVTVGVPSPWYSFEFKKVIS